MLSQGNAFIVATASAAGRVFCILLGAMHALSNRPPYLKMCSEFARQLLSAVDQAKLIHPSHTVLYDMGNCCSSNNLESPSHSHAELSQDSPFVGLTNKSVYPVHGGGDLQIVVSTAKFAADLRERTPVLVKLTPKHVFVALFDGLGDSGPEIVTFCKNNVYEVFLDCCSQHSNDMSAALKQTFAQLDRLVLESKHITAKGKAGSGCSGVIGYIDLADQRCIVANVGHSQCLLARIVGSFNAKIPEGFFLSADHTLRNKGERARVHKRTLSDATDTFGTTQVVNGVEMVKGITTLSRAIGFSSCKNKAGSSGLISCTAEVTEHRLTVTDQHLILGSSGVWGTVGAQDAALRAHFYEKLLITESAKVQASAAIAGQPVSAPISPSLRQPNAAEHLLLYSISKVASKLSRRTNSAEPLTVADIMQIPFERQVMKSLENSNTEQQPADMPNGKSSATCIRRDIHGDLAAVVVSLRWQNLSLDSQMRQLFLAAAQNKQPQEDNQLRQLAQARWAQLRMLADFHRVYRRTILRKWWDTADQIYRSGKIQALSLQSFAYRLADADGKTQKLDEGAQAGKSSLN